MTRTQEAREHLLKAHRHHRDAYNAFCSGKQHDAAIYTMQAIGSLLEYEDAKLSESAAGRREPEREAEAGGGEGDQPIPEDDAIHAAHPLKSGRHDLYAEAMRMVGAKRSKGALVDLVTWALLCSEEHFEQFKVECSGREAAEERASKAEAELAAAKGRIADAVASLRDIRGYLLSGQAETHLAAIDGCARRALDALAREA